MTLSSALHSAAGLAGKALTLVSADAKLRVLVGGALSTALAVFGLHVSGDTLLAVVAAGATLAGFGPHLPAASDDAAQ